jgi:hypothetical protein
MSHAPDDDEAPFSGLEPPVPPPTLRARVLKSARETLEREAARDIWTRVWESRPLRVAWAAATLILLAAHLAVPARPPARDRGASEPAAAPEFDPGGELAAVAGLSPLNEDLLPRLEAPADPPAAGKGVTPAAPVTRNRKESVS